MGWLGRGGYLYTSSYLYIPCSLSLSLFAFHTMIRPRIQLPATLENICFCCTHILKHFLKHASCFCRTCMSSPAPLATGRSVKLLLGIEIQTSAGRYISYIWDLGAVKCKLRRHGFLHILVDRTAGGPLERGGFKNKKIKQETIETRGK